MAVIINDVELVVEPPAAANEAAGEEPLAQTGPAAPSPLDLLSVAEHAEGRAQRTRAH